MQAREFFQRDRASFRKAFVGGWSEGLTGERLLESFDVDESFQPDELALLVEADVATVNARLSALADQYVPILEGAVERVLISGTPDIVSTSEPAGKKYGDEIYRILADVDGQRFVYRVRFQDDSRLKELLQKRRILMDVRQKRICETIRVVTGSVRHHTEE